jgi:hypothetical protein
MEDSKEEKPSDEAQEKPRHPLSATPQLEAIIKRQNSDRGITPEVTRTQTVGAASDELTAQVRRKGWVGRV